jgi:hypothetical protein
MPISAKVSERISTQIKKYTPILNELLTKDVNEADTGAITESKQSNAARTRRAH